MKNGQKNGDVSEKWGRWFKCNLVRKMGTLVQMQLRYPSSIQENQRKQHTD